jgi:thioredoxin-like negative regulator of GroEL
MTPIVNGLAAEFEGQVTIHQLDAADPANVQLQSEYGLRGHPSFVVLDADGRSVQTFLGPQSEEALRQAITSVVE